MLREGGITFLQAKEYNLSAKSNMEEPEVPTEQLQDDIKEKAEEASREKEKKWLMYVAISTALVAVFAALTALMAGHHSDEALIEQIKASDQWAYYQAKGIKAEIRSLGIGINKNDSADISKYKNEQEEIKRIAEEHEKESAFHLSKHIVLARAVTLFQIAIAISAIAILTRKRFLWFAGMGLAVIGVVLFAIGVL